MGKGSTKTYRKDGEGLNTKQRAEALSISERTIRGFEEDWGM